MSAPGTVEASPIRVRPRVSAVDGLRGLAIVLVLLAHSIVILPAQERGELGSLAALFNSGNIAVSLFFVIGAFFVTRRLLAASTTHRVLGPLRYMARRTVRIALQVYVLLVAVFVVHSVDPTDTSSRAATVDSLLAVATFRFNDYVRENALSARSDIGQLYYLSIDLQFFLVLMVVIILIGRWRRVLVALLALSLVAALWWRWQVCVEHGWYSAALRTSTRSEAPLAGALAACLLDRARVRDWVAQQSTALAGAAAGLALGLVVSCAFVTIEGYFGLQGAVAAVVFALLVLGLAGGASAESLAVRALAWAPLARIGQWSLTVFVWHTPLWVFVRRHTGDLSPTARVTVGVIALALVVVLVERLLVPHIEALTARLFDRPRGGHATS